MYVLCRQNDISFLVCSYYQSSGPSFLKTLRQHGLWLSSATDVLLESESKKKEFIINISDNSQCAKNGKIAQ